MKLVYRQFDDNFDQLIRYYPRYYRDVQEMLAILHAHGSLADAVDDGIEEIFDDFFVETADETTIAMWEDILDIPYSLIVGRDLEQRRSLVLVLLVGFGHLSASALEQIISTYTGAEVDITLENYGGVVAQTDLYLDGSWDLNGEQRLDGKDSYNGNHDQALFINVLTEGESDDWIETTIFILQRLLPAHLWYVILEDIYTILDNTELENITLPKLKIAQGVPELDCIDYRMDPGVNYGGTRITEEETVQLIRMLFAGISTQVEENTELGVTSFGIRFPEAENYGLKVSVKISTGFYTEPEGIGGDVVLKSHDIWYLDGSLLLNGETLLNSTYEKEEL